MKLASAVSHVSSPFVARHNGSGEVGQKAMLADLGEESLEALMTSIVPESLLASEPPKLPPVLSETECLAQLQRMAESNQRWRSFLGMGYQAAVLPTVIARNVLENPGWYTQYTPYQAEISQGRLEALLNFQTLVCDLTGLPVANSSLLDEGTACAEAMTMALRSTRKPADKPVLLADSQLHPQTIEVVRGRAIPLGLEVTVSDLDSSDVLNSNVFAVLLAYPGTEGQIKDWSSLTAQAQERDITVIFSSDLLSLVALQSPAEMGAHICVGSSQRMGLPMGFGGPHAGFMACTEKFKRQLPGRIVGISTDRLGHQGKAPSRRAGHRAHTHMADTDRHVERGDFVFALLRQHLPV